jgi:tRNA(His) guanylyltransferase
MTSKDSLGDRIKGYENLETNHRLMPGLPMYARIDGRGFSKFTKHMERPFDVKLVNAMIATTSALVEHSHATLGYTQSDEISLVWLPQPGTQPWFDGKVHKLVSVLAGLATSAFASALLQQWGTTEGAALLQQLPHFDCRVFNLPSREEAAHALLWRNLDATKNAVSMAAHHYYSHHELQGKTGAEKQEMMWQKGINFDHYPPHFKRGTWVKRQAQLVALSDHDWGLIPAAHRPASREVLRTCTVTFDLPPLNRVGNRVEVLFEGAEPQVQA